MSANFSADGKRLLVADYSGWAAVFTLEDSKKILDFQVHHSGAIASRFCDEGRQFISVGTNDGPRLFDLEGKVKRTVAGHHNVVNSMALSNDGRTAVAASFGECVIVWDTMTGAEIRRFGGMIYSIVSLDVSEDFRYALLWGHDGRATVWEISTGELVRTIPLRKANISSASLSADALTAALALADGTVEIWDVNNLKLKAVIPTGGSAANHVQFNHAQDRIAVIYYARGAVIYDISKAAPEQVQYFWGSYNAL